LFRYAVYLFSSDPFVLRYEMQEYPCQA
jgi:hypothetical protein